MILFLIPRNKNLFLSSVTNVLNYFTYFKPNIINEVKKKNILHCFQSRIIRKKISNI